MAQKELPAGVRLTEALLNGAYPKGVMYQANRDAQWNIPAANGICLRMDGLALEAGRSYLMLAQQIHPQITGGTGTAVDRFIFSLRYNATASVTAANGAEIGRADASLQPVMNTDHTPPIMGWVLPGSATTAASLGLFGWRTSGSGGSPVLRADAGGLWMSVIDLGISVSDTGTDF